MVTGTSFQQICLEAFRVAVALEEVWPESYRKRGRAATVPGETVPGLVSGRKGELNCAYDQQ